MCIRDRVWVAPHPPEGVQVVPDASIVTVPGYERGCKAGELSLIHISEPTRPY